jgi:hypothetical protein
MVAPAANERASAQAGEVNHQPEFVPFDAIGTPDYIGDPGSGRLGIFHLARVRTKTYQGAQYIHSLLNQCETLGWVVS